MSNPYHDSGSCSSLSDFFDKLITFATSASIDVAYRFTEEVVTTPQNLNTSGGVTGTTYPFVVRCLSRGGYYWWMRYHTTGGVYVMPAPNGGAASWNSVTGKPADDTLIFPSPGAGTYEFFAVNGAIHAVCILGTGVHVHVNFGTGDKVGNWTGGEYFTGSCQNATTSYYQDADSIAHRWIFQNSGTNRTGQRNGKMRVVYNSKNFASMDYNWSSAESGYNLANNVGGMTTEANRSGATFALHEPWSPNSWTPLRTPGVPIEYQLLRDADDGLFYDLMVIPGARFINVKYLNPGDTVNGTWKAFPLSIKGVIGSLNNYACSENYGIAYQMA